jgi:hypothetical protein
MKPTFLKKFVDRIKKEFRRKFLLPCVGDLVEIILIESEEEKVLRRVFQPYETRYVGIIVKLFVIEELGKYDKDYVTVLVDDEVLCFHVSDYKFKVIK